MNKGELIRALLDASFDDNAEVFFRAGGQYGKDWSISEVCYEVDDSAPEVGHVIVINEGSSKDEVRRQQAEVA